MVDAEIAGIRKGTVGGSPCRVTQHEAERLQVIVGQRRLACGDYALQSPHLRREKVGVTAGFGVDSHPFLFNVVEHLSGRKNAYRTPQNLSANIDNPNTTAKKSPAGIESTKDSNSLMLHLLATSRSWFGRFLHAQPCVRRSAARDIP
jgi:hypothetical protein